MNNLILEREPVWAVRLLWFAMIGLTALQIAGFFIGSFLTSPMALVFGCFVLIARVVFFSNAGLFKSPAQLILWVCNDMSFAAYPVFGGLYVKSGVFILDDAFYTSYIIGMFALCVQAGYVFWWNRNRVIPNVKKEAPLAAGIDKYIFPFFIFLIVSAFSFSIISHELGIAKMGLAKESRVILPMGLNGVFVFYRSIVAPFFFIWLIDFYDQRRWRGWLLVTVSAFIAWQALEMVVRFSKGQFVVGMLILGIWMITRRRLRFFHLVFASLGFALFIAAYSYLGTFRAADNRSLTQNDDITFVMRSAGYKSYLNNAGKAYDRIFRPCAYLITLHGAFGGDLFFSNFRLVYYYKGASSFFTRSILGYDGDYSFSAGTNMLGEAFIMGGLAFTVFMIFLYYWIASRVDARRLSIFTCNGAAKAYMTYMMFAWVSGGFYTQFLKGSPTWIPLLCVFGLNYYIYKRFRMN